MYDIRIRGYDKEKRDNDEQECGHDDECAQLHNAISSQQMQAIN
jgi:hypothetical protein